MTARRIRGSRWAWGFLGALALSAAAAPLLAPYAVDAVELAARRAAPSAAHWFGTDELGRDLFTRVLWGARVSLVLGGLAALASAIVGTAVGSVAALGRPWVDDLLMRLTDAMLAIPRLPLLMLAAAVLHPGIPLLVVLVGGTGWMETARVVRAEVRTVATQEYVEASRAVGASPWRTWWRQLLPGVLPAVQVATTLAVARSLLLESTLSFLGVGVQPPTASWGSMLYQAQATMATAPWLAVFPGACICATVLACNLAGDRAS
jgi:peptide/nickel transport system permease protein